MNDLTQLLFTPTVASMHTTKRKQHRHPIVTVTEHNGEWLAYVAQRRTSGYGRAETPGAAVLAAWNVATRRYAVTR